MMRRAIAGLIVCAAILAAAEPASRSLFDAANGFRAATLQPRAVTLSTDERRLQLDAPAVTPGGDHRSVVFPLPAAGRDFTADRYIECEVVNVGARPAVFTFWALSGPGWGGVSTFSATQDPGGRETIAPGARKILRIDLHAKYSGRAVYTKAIDPGAVRALELVFEQDNVPMTLALGEIRAVAGPPATPHDPSRRVRVPEVLDAAPAPGRRVYQQAPGWEDTQVRHVLTLPRDWVPKRRYPVIVEYTGNIFYHKYCHSTGHTDQGNLAYGLARGEQFICLNLPYVSADGQREQVDGWGDIDRGIAYCLAALKQVEERFGGDPRAIFYTGFSRGSYGANYLALRDDRIAAVWAGFLTLHDPGAPWTADKGHGWRGVDVGWNERAARMRGRPWFHQDDELGPEVHVDVEFLEDRPSTIATRRWLQEIVARATNGHN